MSKPSEDVFCHPESLTLFHYGELDPADHLRLEKHLQGCAACRRELAQLRATLEILPKVEPEFSPEEVRSFNERVGRSLRPKQRHFFRPAYGWSLAATAAVLLMVTLHSPAPGPREKSPGVALRTASEIESLPEPELLLNMELLENLDLLQELEGTGISG